MNEEKRKENKKSDKKALMIFIPCLIISFFAGFGLSGLGNYMEANIADVIAETVVKILVVITPYANLVINTVTILVCVIILANAKKRIKVWDGENEEEYEKFDRGLSVASIIINIGFIISYFFFAAGFEYCITEKGTGIVELVCYFAGFILALIGNLAVQANVVNLYKELNPEKKGSVYALDFGKQWEQSCDEAERIQIYKAAFGSYSFCNVFYVFLWLFCLVGSQIWHFGIMPATIVVIVWLVQFISYQAYAAYYTKNPNKI